MRTWRPEWLLRPAAVAIIRGQLKAPLIPLDDMFVLAAVDWLRRRVRLGRALTTDASPALLVMSHPVVSGAIMRGLQSVAPPA